MEAIGIALLVLQSGDDKGEVQVTQPQDTPWLLSSVLAAGRFQSVLSQKESARSNGLASLAGGLLRGRTEPLLSCVPVGGLSLVVAQCTAMQVGCQ